MLFQSQKLAQEADDNVTNAMWAKLRSASIPDEFRPGIVVDMAEKNGWNMSYIHEGLNRIMEDAAAKGIFKRPGDAARYCRNQFNNINNHAKRRMES